MRTFIIAQWDAFDGELSQKKVIAEDPIKACLTFLEDPENEAEYPLGSLKEFINVQNDCDCPINIMELLDDSLVNPAELNQ